MLQKAADDPGFSPFSRKAEGHQLHELLTRYLADGRFMHQRNSGDTEFGGHIT